MAIDTGPRHLSVSGIRFSKNVASLCVVYAIDSYPAKLEKKRKKIRIRSFSVFFPYFIISQYALVLSGFVCPKKYDANFIEWIGCVVHTYYLLGIQN